MAKEGKTEFTKLLAEIRACQECEPHLPLGPRPVLAADPDSKILIVGQAPGIRVHQSNVPWDDPSGNRLRDWMGIDKPQFYNERVVAIVPMGFCYPGTGKSGDLPPRPECRQLWHDQLLAQLTEVRLTLVIGAYAHDYCLGTTRKRTLTQTVQAWKQYTPKHLPLPHPSPRNNRWLAKNPWFEVEVLPWLKQRIKRLLKPS